ncbi:VOC family protein [Tahibacter sp.]|uniref:VOC family protein n=1 Tax=Tahibacter sp. TaxID=2056211 RepID=UPI0028C3DE74|nr:VOC family protein [Tahibacter sp.]
MISFRLHHLGCAVACIEDSLRMYTGAMGFSRVSAIYELADLKVRVCFVETAPDVFVELVQATAADSPASAFLTRRQYYYHACYVTPDVRAAVAHLEASGYRLLSLAASEVFAGAEFAFLLTPESALVEICTEGMFARLLTT